MSNRIQEAYINGATDSLQKVAGLPMELVGTIGNPLNTIAGLPAFVAGTLMGDGDKENIGDSAALNLFMPGVAPYRLGERLQAHLLED